MLEVSFTPRFSRDIKKAKRRYGPLDSLREVIDLIAADTAEAKEMLRVRHNAHRLKGSYLGLNECHVANIGDWLLIWGTDGNHAVMYCTGSYDDLF